MLALSMRSSVADWTFGEKLLAPLFADERLRPTVVRTLEESYPVVTIEDCRKAWESYGQDSHIFYKHNFEFLKCQAPRLRGMVRFSTPADIASENRFLGNITCEATYSKRTDWISLFAGWCEITDATYGYIHPAPKEEKKHDVWDYPELSKIDEWRAQKSKVRYYSGLPYVAASNFPWDQSNFQGISDLGWVSWFGSEFYDLVDDGALEEAGFRVERVGRGKLVFICDQIDAVTSDIADFRLKKVTLRKLFPAGTFLAAPDSW